MKIKHCIISVLMLFFACSAMTQNTLWIYPDSQADTTIVRQWKAGMYVVYSRYGTTRRVTLHDNQSTAVNRVDIPSVYSTDGEEVILQCSVEGE